MASVAQLKAHLSSVNSTKQITSAMQLISASKMRKAADRGLSTQPYHREISELLIQLKNKELEEKHPLMAHREIKARILVVIASDTGLAGAYNANVFKQYIKELEIDRKRNVKTYTIAVGRKAARFAAKLKEEIIGVYEGVGTGSAASERNAIIDTVITKFRAKEVDAVDIIYTKFRSTTKQEVSVWNLLPAGHINDGIAESKKEEEYVFEPGREKVFSALVKRAVEIQVAQALFDSVASEHSTRMIAMKNATDNATELSEDLTLAMNKARQAAITNELIDISNGANAVE